MGDTPVPIPNTAVKLHSAHGTAGIVRGRVGLRQGFLYKGSLLMGRPFVVLKQLRLVIVQFKS